MSRVSAARPPSVACISLEPWDETWRRNQHFSAQLVRQGLVRTLLFVEPPILGRLGRQFQPEPGIQVLRPTLLVPKRAGGLALVGRWLRFGALRGVDILWVNDPQLGVHCLGGRTEAVYDVTDDWRSFDQPQHIVRRIVEAEDRLALLARTIVCSDVLARRWQQRYLRSPPVVQNAVDLEAFRVAKPVALAGARPHFGYVGTLHAQRLDVPLLLDLADLTQGTVHLVGPDALDGISRNALEAHPRILLHPPVPAAAVPRWMKAMDVLLCPHLINEFTLSLDAIKSHEYLASGRPVVATPTSGFQNLTAEGVDVVPASRFAGAAAASSGSPPVTRTGLTGWSDRTREFRRHLVGEADSHS